MYTDSGYDEAALQYNMMGIQYSIPLTCEISIDAWNAATNNDGSIPQKNDVVYIPQSNKLYDVVSINPVKTVASQITSYKCNLAIHKNKRSVLLNKDVEDTIDNYTNSIESVFGNDIILSEIYVQMQDGSEYIIHSEEKKIIDWFYCTKKEEGIWRNFASVIDLEEVISFTVDGKVFYVKDAMKK
jgi:hypothetical protein